MSYLANQKYEALIDDLFNPPRCPITGQVDRDAIKRILGERADVWPASVRQRSSEVGNGE